MAPTSGEEMVVRLLAENSYDFFFFWSHLKTFTLILAFKDFDAEKFIARGRKLQCLLEAPRQAMWMEEPVQCEVIREVLSVVKWGVHVPPSWGGGCGQGE